MIDSKGKKEISAESAITIFELTKLQANQIAEWIEKDHLQDFRELASDEELQEGLFFFDKETTKSYLQKSQKAQGRIFVCQDCVNSREEKETTVRIKPIEELIRKLDFQKQPLMPLKLI